MGRLLQIRVQASTYDPGKAEAAWPKLWKLAWPTKAFGPEGAGVLQLVQALDEQRRFGSWSTEVKEALGPEIEEAARIKSELERSLGDWKAGQAEALSTRLEDALDQLEKAVPR